MIAREKSRKGIRGQSPEVRRGRAPKQRVIDLDVLTPPLRRDERVLGRRASRRNCSLDNKSSLPRSLVDRCLASRRLQAARARCHRPGPESLPVSCGECDLRSHGGSAGRSHSPFAFGCRLPASSPGSRGRPPIGPDPRPAGPIRLADKANAPVGQPASALTQPSPPGTMIVTRCPSPAAGMSPGARVRREAAGSVPRSPRRLRTACDGLSGGRLPRGDRASGRGWHRFEPTARRLRCDGRGSAHGTIHVRGGRQFRIGRDRADRDRRTAISTGGAFRPAGRTSGTARRGAAPDRDFDSRPCPAPRCSDTWPVSPSPTCTFPGSPNRSA